MLTLVQAAVMQAPPSSFGDVTRALTSLTPFALLILGWMQTRSASDRTEMRADLKTMAEAITVLRTAVTTLNTHVGVDGNGIISRLDAITGTLAEIQREMAENRGASRKGG